MKRKLNYRLLIPILILSVISIISIAMTLKYTTQTEYIGTALDKTVNQSIGFIVGFIIILISAKLEIPKMRKLVNLAYYVLLIMLFILIAGIPGVSDFFTKTINGARGWFRFFPNGPTIQPVEFMKITMIVKLGFITQDHLNSDDHDYVLFRKYMIYGLIPIALVLIQPDLGGAILLGVPWLFMLLISIKNKTTLRIITALILLAMILFGVLLVLPQGQEILTKFTPLQAYQLERLNAWLEPFSNSKGLQLQQSLILMGSAGATGHGVAYNAISIPEPYTDMIFAQIVGMFGYVLGAFIIFIYVFLINEILNIAKKVQEPFYKVIAVGIAALFIIQVTENIGMIIGLLPITGIVLPFLSYGVSALVSYSMVIGVALNADQHITKEEQLRRKR